MSPGGLVELSWAGQGPSLGETRGCDVFFFSPVVGAEFKDMFKELRYEMVVYTPATGWTWFFYEFHGLLEKESPKYCTSQY